MPNQLQIYYRHWSRSSDIGTQKQQSLQQTTRYQQVSARASRVTRLSVLEIGHVTAKHNGAEPIEWNLQLVAQRAQASQVGTAPSDPRQQAFGLERRGLYQRVVATNVCHQAEEVVSEWLVDRAFQLNGTHVRNGQQLRNQPPLTHQCAD
jgi:hypothetical protein